MTTINQADEAYLQIVRWIFTVNPTTKPSTENQLLRTLELSGVYRDNLRRLLFERSNRFPKLFTHLRNSKLLKLVQSSLDSYPNTYSFLRRVVWHSGTVHPWLERPEQIRGALIEEERINALTELRRMPSKRDKSYCTLFGFITKSVTKFDSFKTKDELVEKLTESKLERFVIEYLLGIDGNLNP